MSESARKAIDELRQQSESLGNSSMTLDDINEEIRQARDERRQRKMANARMICKY